MADWKQHAEPAPAVKEAVRPFNAKPPGEGHRGRLRERFLQSGLDGFLDYEVVELLLTLATPRKDCKAQAKAAMERFGSLQGVLAAPPHELQEVSGLGQKNTLGIRLVLAVAEKYLEQRLASNGGVIRSSRELFDYLVHTLRDKKTEVFKAIFLNTQNQVLAVETPFEGTLDSACIYPRELVKTALERHASSVLFAHNHPSGNIQPSREDIRITRQLVYTFHAFQITVLEHLIIGGGEFFSFADSGHLNVFSREFDKMLG